MQTYAVYFPTVHHQRKVLAQISILKHDTVNALWLSLAPSAKAKHKEISDVLDSIRHQENPETGKLSVAVDFININSKNLLGQSYTLALALADKCARLNTHDADLVLIATGIININSGCVEKIDCFDDKLTLLQDELAQGKLSKNCYFLYPTANHDKDNPQLQTLQKIGVQLCPLNHWHDAEFLWQPNSKAIKTDIKPKTSCRWCSTAITLVLMIILAISLKMSGLLGQSNAVPTPKYNDCQALPLSAQKLQDCANKNRWLSLSDFNLSLEYRRYVEDFSRVYPLENGSILSFGDQFKIRFDAPVTAYVYVYHLNSEGELTELQHALHRHQRLNKGLSVILPKADRAFTLDDKAGKETLMILASVEEDKMIYPHYLTLKAALNSGDMTLASQLQQAILSVLQNHQKISFHHQP